MLYAEEIDYISPHLICQIFAEQPGTTLLESTKLQKPYGHYSFLGIDPFAIYSYKLPDPTNPFTQLQTILPKYSLEPLADLPPFQGGVAGYFGYDCRHYLEKLPPTLPNEIELPDAFFGCYDLVVSFDEYTQRAWICSSGFPEHLNYQQHKRAKQRCQWLKQQICQLRYKFQCGNSTPISPTKANTIISNFSEQDYIQAVQKTKNYIYAGDIFEANISQRFLATSDKQIVPFALYEQLRQQNPAPFSAYLCTGDSHIVSASPERFLKLHDDHIEARPIKGTSPRHADPEQDALLAQKLVASRKDNAENIMIVDLMRNDLSKVCLDNSIVVPQLCGLESYASVHHLVSVIKGKLSPKHDPIDLLKATFPGGSITGAPKIRAMEIISEIEKISRGPYCGSIGYIGFNGTMDTSITIRTYTIKNNIISFHAGGAITLDSNPRDEYAETLTKASALIKILQQ